MLQNYYLFLDSLIKDSKFFELFHAHLFSLLIMFIINLLFNLYFYYPLIIIIFDLLVNLYFDFLLIIIIIDL
jgi:hypothetical protein